MGLTFTKKPWVRTCPCALSVCPEQTFKVGAGPVHFSDFLIFIPLNGFQLLPPFCFLSLTLVSILVQNATAL